MTDTYTLSHFERELEHWKHWVQTEQEALEKCPEETKPHIEVRLAMGKRNVLEIEKTLSVLKPEKPVDYPQVDVEELVKGLVQDG